MIHFVNHVPPDYSPQQVVRESASILVSQLPRRTTCPLFLNVSHGRETEHFGSWRTLPPETVENDFSSSPHVARLRRAISVNTSLHRGHFAASQNGLGFNWLIEPKLAEGLPELRRLVVNRQVGGRPENQRQAESRSSEKSNSIRAMSGYTPWGAALRLRALRLGHADSPVDGIVGRWT